MRRWLRAAGLAGGGCVLAVGMLFAAANQGPTAMADGSVPIGTTVTPGQPPCTAPSRPALAARMSAQIAAALGVQTVSGIARVVNQDLSSRLALQAPAGPASRTLAAARPGKGGGTGSGPGTRSAPRSLPRQGVLDWLGGAAIAAALALLVVVAHLRRRRGTLAD